MHDVHVGLSENTVSPIPLDYSHYPLLGGALEGIRDTPFSDTYIIS